ncbi:hypothetical protein EV122DRAFT_258531 [Schizophyllum commune]|nr:hypothetical protein K525DRAFT_261752 [Schizophyllum commune Loenen D]
MYSNRAENYPADYQSAMSRSSASSEISPSLTQSSISSNSSTSPLPRTPVRNARARATRYPDNLGRVPLHRRGTSQTYERLEDLLREAGYKETRVFTPESERVKHESPEPKRPVPLRQDRVGSVVNFFSGLIPGSTANSRPSSPNLDGATPTPTPPPRPFTPTRTSPLANRQQQRKSPMYSTSPLNSSVESLTRTPTRTPRPPKQQRIAHKPPLPPNPMAPLHRPLPRDVRHSASIASLRRQQEKFAHQPLPARHVSGHPRQLSAPHMQRPRSTPPVVRPQALPPMQTSHSEQPPLPQTWLQTVARAVMFGGAGYVGGPHKGKENELLPPPPSGPPSYLVLSKRSVSTASVSETQVLCRSAPASRSNSLARNNSRRNVSTAHRKAPSLEVPDPCPPRRGRKQGKRAGGDRVAVPSLARTDTQSDPLRALEDEEGGEDHLSSGSVVSSEDEGELNLAKMLVPPKRQHSIRSLRRHLAPPPTPSSSTFPKSGTMRSDRSVRDVVNASPVPRPADHAVDLNDAAEEYLMFLEGSNSRRNTDSRKGLPRAWGGLLHN